MFCHVIELIWRQRLTKLQEELADERRRQQASGHSMAVVSQDLHRALRKAVEDRESGVENQRALKVSKTCLVSQRF